ncbi:MAG: adenine phosphoribosyltransferase [Lentisphaerae bacterium]|nr:adenine phosphoribosyltransferase [Lentisphaerota bacterium]
MKYRDVFANQHVVLPVIHVESLEQALRNVRIAHDAGADGVFLINHGSSSSDLLAVHEEVWKEYPDWWVGVNCLDLNPSEVFARVSEHVAGVWADNAMIDENREDQFGAKAILEAKQKSGWKGLYFGGVAFKYQRQVNKLRPAARIASRYMDVVTTSGPGTGKAADVEKIRDMKNAIGDFPMAIASGITPENVVDYLDIADGFLVATGISSNFTELDAGRVKALVRAVRSHAPGKRSSQRTT